jgi:site-specific recombinase XerC
MGVYKRGDTWCISYFLNGQRVRKAIGANKKKAEAELEATRVDIRNGRYKEPRRDSFDDLVTDYETQQKDKKGYRTEKYIIQRIGSYFKGAIVQDIGVREVEVFMAHLCKLPVKGGGIRGGSDVNHHMVCLCSILQKAVLWEWIDRNPAVTDKVKRPPKGDGRDTLLTVEQAGDLLGACLPHLYPIVLCALDTGMRKSEILGLRWSEIRDGMIHLPASRTKTGKARKVPIAKTFGEELQRIKEKQRSKSVVSLFDLVFQAPRERKYRRKAKDGERGKLYIVTDPMKDIRAAWDAAKVKGKIDPGLHFHDLRRTFRSHMKMAGVDSFTLNLIDGHANPKIETVYTQLDDEHLKRAIAHVPMWHKSGTVGEGKEKGPEGRNPPALVFAGAEGGI